MINITNTSKTYTNYSRNKINFRADNIHTSLKPKTDEDKEKLKKAIKTTGLIAAGISAIYAFFKYKNSQKIKNETNKIYNKIKSLLGSNENIKAEVEKVLKDFPAEEKLKDRAQGSTTNYKALKSFKYMLAMDGLDGVPEDLKLPELITFDKVEGNTLNYFIGSFFKDSKPNTVQINYKGSIQKALEALKDISSKNNNERTIVYISNSGEYNFAQDIAKNQEAKQVFVDFFNNIQDKKVSLITSDKKLLDFIKKCGINPKKLNINYRIKSLSQLLQVS